MRRALPYLFPWQALLFCLVFLALVAAASAQVVSDAPYLCGTCEKSFALSQATGRTALPSTNTAYTWLTVLNTGTDPAYVVQGDSTVVATTSSIQIPGGKSVVMHVTGTYLAGIADTGKTPTILIYQASGATGP